MSLLWVDLETTGLEPERHAILEVAAILTDWDLNEVGRYHAVQTHHADVKALMDEYVLNMHTQNYLLDEIENGEWWREINTGLLELLKQVDDKPLLAGSSVHFDRAFLQVYYPDVVRELHYRNVDVSTLRSICREWRPDVLREWDSPHRAMPDVEATLDEFRHYRSNLFGVA